jgi:tetratricopeptide (TPR) repeat protein
MARKNNKRPITDQINPYSQNSPILFWLITFFTVSFLFVSPFHKALFNGGSYQFEGPIYGSLIWSSILLILLAIYLFKVWKNEEEINSIAIFVWLIPLAYLISVFNAASTHAAINSVYIHVMYAIFFIAGVYLARNVQGLTLLKWSILSSGYVIVIFGFMNLFADASIFGLINYSEGSSSIINTYKDAVRQEARGIRLTSVFQYANTYAAYLIGLFLAALILLSSSRRWYSISISSMMLVPIISSIILTSSRGGIIVLPIIFVILLPFLKLSRQIIVGIHFLIALITSIVITESMSTIGQELQSNPALSLQFKGWFILVLASIIAAIMSYALQRFGSDWITDKIENFVKVRFSNLILPFLCIVLGSISILALFGNMGLTNVLPDSIQQRVENINFQQHSVLERGTFYSNAMEVIKDHAIIGAGGGAWSALYEKYQTNPYTSRQAHNFFLQYFIEVGLIGFTILIFFLGYIFYNFISNYARSHPEPNDDRLIFFIFAVSILIHSIIDFNMSYVYIGTLVFLCLGVMSANFTFPAKIKALQSRRWIKYFPAALILLAIVVFFGSIRLYQANNLFQSAINQLQQQKPLQEILEPLNSSIQISSNPDALNYKISVLRQAHEQFKDDEYKEVALETIRIVKDKEPYNRQVVDHEYAIYVAEQRYKDALLVVSRGINLFPWDISLYERAIALNFELGSDVKEPSNPFWNQALELYNIVLSKENELQQLPEGQQQGRPFEVTPQIQAFIDQIHSEM